MNRTRRASRTGHAQPVTVRYFGMDPSDAVTAKAMDDVQRLHKHYPDLRACHVRVQLDHKHQHQGRPFSVVIDATLFSDALRQVVSAASTDESRQVLTGVLMAAEGDGLRLAATDSYRLAVRDLPGTAVMSEGQQVLVPSGALKELSRLLSTAETVIIRLGDRDVTFEVDDARLTSRLIVGDFPPNYRALIPSTHPNCLIVGREPLLEALRRMRLIAKEAKDATPVRLVLTADGVELLVSSSELGQAREEIDARHEGEELTVAFNPDYLIDGLEVMPGDEVMLETIHPQKPALLRSSASAADATREPIRTQETGLDEAARALLVSALGEGARVEAQGRHVTVTFDGVSGPQARQALQTLRARLRAQLIEAELAPSKEGLRGRFRFEWTAG